MRKASSDTDDVRSHTPAQYADDGFFLYWHAPSGAGTFTVTDTITLADGTVVPKTAKYSVKSPGVSVEITDNTSNITVEPNILTTKYKLGNADPAVKFDATMEDGPGGTLAWAQLINWQTRAYFDRDPGAFANPSIGPGEYIITAQGLDVMFPLPDPFTDPPYATVPNFAGESGLIIHEAYFETHLMWQSSRTQSLEVTLKRVDWSFEFAAWSVPDPTIPAGWRWGPVAANSSSVGDAYTYTAFPEWESKVELHNRKVYYASGLEETMLWEPLG